MGMRSVLRLVVSVAFCLACVACGENDDTSPPVTTMPRLERAACDFTLPQGQTAATVDCGSVIVQEDRNRSNGRTVRIPFIVLKATDPHPAGDPIVYLHGGPGDPILELIQSFGAGPFAPFQAQRDLVFFDQRGTGRSEPSLDCPEWRDAFSTFLAEAQTVEEDAAALLTAMRTCHGRLMADGVNFAAYTSSASAHDLKDLMIALGYREWNVYGGSYGTRLALTAMRDAPQGIRSVGLDSTVPVQENLIATFAANFQRSLDTLFAGCAKDPACNAAFPNLEQTFFDLVDRLNRAPVTLRPKNPMTGEPFTVVVTGDRLLFGIQQALYRRDLIPLLPVVITSAAKGRYSLLTEGIAAVAVPSTIAWGMNYSIQCGEEAPFITPEILAAATNGVREEVKKVGLAYYTQLTFDVCAFWGSSPPATIENEPVVSDIPTLVLAGEYDPITPPAYGRLVAQTLSHSSFFELPGFAHGLDLSPGCVNEIVTAFLNDPTQPLDGSCVAALPPPHFLGT